MRGMVFKPQERKRQGRALRGWILVRMQMLLGGIEIISTIDYYNTV